jgi:hypothetical protein
MTTSQTGKTTIYYITYTGNTVPVYTGSADIAANITSNQMSLTLQSSGAGVTNSNSVFDIWDYYNSGTPVLCVATNGSGGGWASDTGGSNTARGTGYSQLDRTTRSYPTNANALANCYNGSTNYGSIGANQATYLGSVCTDAASAGQVSYTFGGAASGGSAARFCVWNNWNRHLTTTNVIDNGASYGYSSSTIQAARASNTNRVTYLMGLPEDAIETKSAMVLQLAAIAFDYSNTGICVDSTSAFFNVSSFLETPTATALIAAAYQPNSIAPQTGLHFIQQCQAANNVNTTTFDYSSNDSLEVTIWN